VEITIIMDGLPEREMEMELGWSVSCKWHVDLCNYAALRWISVLFIAPTQSVGVTCPVCRIPTATQRPHVHGRKPNRRLPFPSDVTDGDSGESESFFPRKKRDEDNTRERRVLSRHKQPQVMTSKHLETQRNRKLIVFLRAFESEARQSTEGKRAMTLLSDVIEISWKCVRELRWKQATISRARFNRGLAEVMTADWRGIEGGGDGRRDC
jgi:hypothetical protein